MKNKKGTIFDMFFVVIFLVVIAFVAVVALNLWNEVSEELDPHLSPEGQAAMARADVFLQGYDYVIVFLFIGFYLAALIGAFMIDTHPALFFLSLLFLIVLGVVAAQLSNMWGEIGNVTALETEVSAFPMTDHLLRNLPLISVALGMILLIVLYMKTQGGTGV